MPETVVMKFGGTSVAAPEDIRRAARRIVDARERGKQVVAVLSARGKTTDELVAQAYEISERPLAREMDMLLSTGERISCALCAMAIHDLGHSAISLTGSQAGIVTDSSHTKARILEVRADRIRDALGRGPDRARRRLPGRLGDSRDVTTLGRGGSDTTAVALAAALGADLCEIYTDVAGVFCADPRLVADAAQADAASRSTRCSRCPPRAPGCCSCARSSTGATTASASTAASSFEDGPGTLVLGEDETMERPMVTAVTHAHEARVTLTGVRDEPGVAGRDLQRARRRQRQRRHDHPERAGLRRPEGRPLVHRRQRRPAGGDRRARAARRRAAIETDRRAIGKVSIVGAGMRSHPGVAAKVFQTLGEHGINIEMISTSPIKISCVIAADRVPDAVARAARRLRARRRGRP